jgi:hypothetical protein
MVQSRENKTEQNGKGKGKEKKEKGVSGHFI